MTFDAYWTATLAALAARLTDWAGVQAPGPEAVLVGVLVGVMALWMGAMLATRLLAQTSAGAALGLALTWLALAAGAHALSQTQSLPPAAQAAAAGLALTLMVFAGTRILATSVARALGVLILSAGFGGLTAVLIALFWRLMTAL